ncbi:MAG: hypothetical protein EXR79_00485 [Myxococcales bacterium]|nr:hypothetical protein [Myxococcales bacterium]
MADESPRHAHGPLRRGTVVAVTLLLATHGAIGTAQPAATGEEARERAEALEVFRQGKLAYKAGDYDAALRLFQTAHGKYSKEPLIILALAKTLDQARNVETAQKYYRLFLDQAPLTADFGKDREATAARVRDIDKELAARPGVLKFKGLPSGAQLEVGGLAADVDAQGELKVPAGTYSVRVVMEKREPFERPAVAVGPGETKVIEVVLVAPVDATELPRDHKWTWAAGSAAAASLLTGGAFAVLAWQSQGAYSQKFEGDGQPSLTARATRKIDGNPCRIGFKVAETGEYECEPLLKEGRELKAERDERLKWMFVSLGAAATFGFVAIAAYSWAPVRRTTTPASAASDPPAPSVAVSAAPDGVTLLLRW